MDEKMMFQQLDFYRHLTLSLFDSLDESSADVVPEGYNNSIRWNLGHILVATENLALGYAGLEMNVPNEYIQLFVPGTKPDDWKITPPTLEELKTLLTAQPERIKLCLEGKLAQPLAKPFHIPGLVEFQTVGENLNFALYHEGQHTGFIKALTKAIK
jgi:hypothetical protein